MSKKKKKEPKTAYINHLEQLIWLLKLCLSALFLVLLRIHHSGNWDAGAFFRQNISTIFFLFRFVPVQSMKQEKNSGSVNVVRLLCVFFNDQQDDRCKQLIYKFISISIHVTILRRCRIIWNISCQKVMLSPPCNLKQQSGFSFQTFYFQWLGAALQDYKYIITIY